MASKVDPSVLPLKPTFTGKQDNSVHLQAVIDKLKLTPHVEGGYFVETDRDNLRVPTPFTSGSLDTRAACTTIHYLLAPESPLGCFHRNRGRTVHTLHRGRGRYVIIHADEVAHEGFPGGYGGAGDVTESQRWMGVARVESFVVGQDVLKGERLQWIVDGGKYKCSFLLPDEADGELSEGLLISEVVVPGFEYDDHDFMRAERLNALVSKEQAEEMSWMLRKNE